MLTSRKFTKIFYSFLAFLLVFSTITPFGVEAAGEEVIVNVFSDVTEEGFSAPQSLILQLPEGKSWVNNAGTFSKLNLLLDGMKADINQTEWDEYKKNITATLSDINPNDKRTLTLSIPGGEYSIPKDQSIVLNFTGALIENWEGTVKPLSFTITAKSRISLGGTIFNATENDLRNGGKTIELNLLNATWNTEKLKTWTELLEVLDRFKLEDDNTWPVINDLKLKDPNKFVSFSADNKTLKITLPPFKNTYPKSKVKFKYAEDNSLNNYINLPSGVTKLYAGESLVFTVNGVTLGDIITIQSNLDEATINNEGGGNATIKFELKNGALWNNLNDSNLGLLKDALKVNSQSVQWEEIKKKLNFNVDSTNKILTITIPTVNKELYSLTENQIIKFKVPYQLLQNAVDLPEQQLTITASPKAIIKGTVRPSVSQADIIKGGKTIVVELVNANWSSDIATNTTKREALLGGFTWATSIKEAIKVSADVKRTSDKVVTITLPPLPGYKITTDQKVDFTIPTEDNPTLTDKKVVFNSIDAFKITPTDGQSATISGSILTNTNEFDIIKGGKEITITLKNDMWIKDVNTNDKRIRIHDTDTLLLGHEIISSTITRVSDTVVKFTLPAISYYSSNTDMNATITIPKELLTISSGLTSIFKISDVQAELSGTALQSLDSTELNKGGKTIIITLNNANFNTNDPNFKNILIGKITSDNISNPLWNSLKTALENNEKNITVSKNKVTIKLPPISYSGVTDAISIRVPFSLIENAPNITDSLFAGAISIGQIGTATLEGNSLFISDILSSSNNIISIKLDGTTWDPAITTNTSKQSTLLKGFIVDDQAKEWAKVISKIKSSTSNFTLSGDKKILSIRIPAVSDYSIVRNQIVDIKIPSSVLLNYKYDIVASGKINISIPPINSYKSLGKLLNEDFNEYIKTGFEQIRVNVPAKKIQTITSNTISISNSQTITTIEVVPNDKVVTNPVEKIILTYKSLPVSGENAAIENTLEATKVNGKFMFIINNLPKNTEIQFSAYGSNSEKIQADIFKKIGSGNKVFNELPKNDLTGSYSLYNLLTDKSLMKDILKYYSVDDLIVGK